VARIPPIDESRPELVDLIGRIKAGRGGLLNIYKLLLHSPAVAERWMGLIDALRNHTELNARLREIAIIRAAHLNRSAYEIRQHVPRLATAAGLTQEECRAIAAWPDTTTLGDCEAAVVAYADAVSRNVQVEDAIFDRLRPHLTDREILELTIIIGVYNMHARVIEPLEVDLEP
jgi:alkylhydroperoxidase family enzyme